LEVNAAVQNFGVKDASSESSSDPESGRKMRSQSTKALLTHEHINALPLFSGKPKIYIDSHPELTSIQRV